MDEEKQGKFPWGKKSVWTPQGILKEKIKFSGLIVPEECTPRSKQTKIAGKLIISEYWVMKSRKGARFTIFDAKCLETIEFGELNEVRGEVAIAPGGTFLNVKSIEKFVANTYKSSKEYEESKEKMEILS